MSLSLTGFKPGRLLQLQGFLCKNQKIREQTAKKKEERKKERKKGRKEGRKEDTCIDTRP